MYMAWLNHRPPMFEVQKFESCVCLQRCCHYINIFHIFVVLFLLYHCFFDLNFQYEINWITLAILTSLFVSHCGYFINCVLHMQDSFTRCFKSNSPEPWNWNIYLFPLWCFGVVIRYGILFPLRYLSVKIFLIHFPE